MSTTTILYLDQPAADEVQLSVADDQGNIQPDTLPIKDLAGLPETDKLVVLFPSSHVAFTSEIIPSKNQQQIQMAALSLLEEKIIDDVEDMHIITVNESDGKTSIAAVRRDYLSDILERLAEFSIRPDIIIPDCLALPVIEDGCSIVQMSNYFLIRNNGMSGVQCDYDWLQTEDDSIINKTIPTCEHVSIYTAKEANPPQGIHYEKIAKQVNEEEQPCTLVELAIASLPQFTRYNFLTGEFKPVNKSGQSWITPRLPVYAIAASLMLFTLAVLVQNLMLQNRLNETRSEIDSVFRSALPEVTTIVDYRLQFERELQKAKSSGGSNTGLWSELHGILSRFNQVPDIELVNLNLKNSRYSLDTRASDIATTQKLIQELDKSPTLMASLINVQNQKDGTQARIRVVAEDGQ